MSSSTNNDGLIKLDEIAECRAWNYEKPTLVSAGRYTKKLPTKSATFRDNFYEHYPALRELDMRNVIFKGGCLLDLLLGNEPKDLDMFLVGLDSEEATLQRVRDILAAFLQIEKDRLDARRKREVQRCYEKNLDLDRHARKFSLEIKAVRQGCVITITLSAVKIPVQIVLLRFDGIGHCLADDDLGATAIAFDGQDVWLNGASRFALENLTIMVDPRKLTAMGSKRLQKYFHKGFDIALPELDIAKLPRHYLKLEMCDAAELPGLVFAYDRIQGNKIFLERFIDRKSQQEEEEEAPSSGYPERRAQDDQQFNIRQENIEKLAKGKSDFSIFAEGDFLLNVLDMSPGITPRQIANFYQAFRRQMVRDHSLFDFGIARRYFVMHSVADIAARLFTAKDIDEALEQLTQEHIRRAEAKLLEPEYVQKRDQQVPIRRKQLDDPEVFQRIYPRNADFYGAQFYKPAAEEGQQDRPME